VFFRNRRPQRAKLRPKKNSIIFNLLRDKKAELFSCRVEQSISFEEKLRNRFCLHGVAALFQL
jgi:hypothetical protein